MEEIDFSDENAAFDKLLELANCKNEKENLMDNDFDLDTLMLSDFEQLRLVTSKIGSAVRLSKIIDKYRDQFNEDKTTVDSNCVVVNSKQDLIREKLNKKSYVPTYQLELIVGETVNDSDKKRIYSDIVSFIRSYTTTVRRGELDGILGYVIGKYPQLCENEFSGYEFMKLKVLSQLKNKRNSKRKRTD